MPTFDFTLTDPSTWTLTGSYDKEKVINTTTDAARYLYAARWQAKEKLYDEEGVPIPFDDLSLVQKKGIIAKEFVFHMFQCAKTYDATSRVDAARDAAIEEAEDKYGLE